MVKTIFSTNIQPEDYCQNMNGTTKVETLREWRFWPILSLSFIFSFSTPLLMLATPIYFYQQGVSIKFISLLATAITITYSISPLILNKISDKLGRRKSIIISMIGAAGAELIFYITLNPIVFLIERLFEGFILGFFFPNLFASISDNPTIDHNKYLARFNLSWSIAAVFGLSFGSFFLQFIGELKLLFYINPFFLLLNVLIALAFFRTSSESKVDPDNSIPDKNQELAKNNNFYIPVIIPLLLILASSFAAGNGSFLYPIKSEILGFSSSSTYLVNVFAILGQSIALYLASLLVLKKLKLVVPIILFIYSFLFIFFNLNREYPLFIVLFMFSGFFYGFLYGTASKMFLTLNIVNKTSKYSSILESSVGLTFFLSQIIIGFVSDIGIGFGYYAISLSLMITFFIVIIFIKKLRSNILEIEPD
ncbi:MAG: MFS transporter [Promethearchaeota archaeon]|jgi:MFS family permease